MGSCFFLNDTSSNYFWKCSDVESVFQTCMWQYDGIQLNICNEDESFLIALLLHVSCSATAPECRPQG